MHSVTIMNTSRSHAAGHRRSVQRALRTDRARRHGRFSERGNVGCNNKKYQYLMELNNQKYQREAQASHGNQSKRNGIHQL